MQQEIINGFRLSPQQGRLWLLQQEGSAYHSQCALLLEGNLEPDVLREALYRVIRRHEILRTTFHSLPGMKFPVQVIADQSTPLWHTIDLSDHCPQEQADKIEDLFREDRNRPFDFGQSPLLRSSLLTLSADNHIFFLSLPAICADAWTLRNLVREISQSYGACLTDKELPDGSMQYMQFSEWRNETLEDEDAETGRAFWRKQVSAPLHTLRLPYESDLPGSISFQPDSFALEVDREVAAKIEAIAGKQGASTAIFLQACWQTLLWRLTEETDIVIGYACDGRQHEVLHSALGLFANWLPIHCHFEKNLRFSGVLSQIAASRRAAYEWEEYFVWDENLLSAGDRAQPLFFPVGFEFDERLSPHQVDGVTVTVYKQHSCTERFNIKLSCYQMGDLLTAEFHYHPERFQPEDVQRLARHFDVLLRSAVEDVEAPIGEMEILSDADRYQLLIAFNNTDTDYPRDKCIHQLFEEQVERTPNHPAVVFGERQLSYAELNGKANQLAQYLQKLGVEPETRVGICLERSLEMVVGILGILKSGGAYLPLEPAYPQERLAYVLAESQATVLLTQERVREHLLEHRPAPLAEIIAIDVDWEVIAQESEENPFSEATAENLAYVIYTSGSTGKPKGVMIEHRSVINLATGLQQTIYAGKPSPLRVSLNAPLTFDASVKQLLQLLYGHTLCILPEEVRSEGNELLSYVNRHALDVLDCTPAQLQLLLAAGLSQKPDSSPKLVLVGGEAIDGATWTFLAKNTLTSFYNVYGPTECTVDATVCCLRAVREPAIGRPIANAKIYLLDEHLKLVPIGIPGELHIGGAGLARGYLAQAELTAERFIPNPFSGEPGARLYKTGDLASYLPDGSIEFLGRLDHQVKLRGFRIELGEIEAVLRQHPGVQESVVVVREDVAGDRRLVAYVLLAAEPGSVINGLRGFLKERLPEYMVPSAFVRLDKLPLTRHGKVNRQALPPPESERPDLHATYVAPRTKIEQTIAAIWQEVLRVERVGIDDNFFDLGGHSLLIVQVHSRLREAFSREISLIQMFRNPTVSSLASYFVDKESPQPALQRAHDRAHKRRRARQTPVREHAN